MQVTLTPEPINKNKRFTQIHDASWDRVFNLSKCNSSAFRLYTFLAKHIDPICGDIICNQRFLADQFNVIIKTTSYWLKFLKNDKAIISIYIAGRICLHALNP